MKVKINKQYWNIHLLPDIEYQAKFGNVKSYDTAAITVYNHGSGARDIFISQSELTKTVVTHELMHAYLSYTDIYSHVKTKTKSKIIEEAEEVMVSKLDNKLHLIAKQASRVYKALR